MIYEGIYSLPFSKDRKSAPRGGELTPKRLEKLIAKSATAPEKWANYTAFGSPMPGRNFTSSNYRYGFNGKEKDDEAKGSGNSYDYGMRIYDPRLGRFLSVDPLSHSYPWYTPYQFAGNKPIWAIDRDGLEDEWYMKAWEGVKYGTGKTADYANKIAQKTVSNVVLATTGIVSPVINAASLVAHEGFKEGSEYHSRNKVDWAVPYKVENWELVPQKQMMNETISTQDQTDIMNATIATGLLVTPIKFPVGSTGSAVLDKGIQMGLSSATKSTIKKVVETTLNAATGEKKAEDETKSTQAPTTAPLYGAGANTSVENAPTKKGTPLKDGD